MWKFWLSFILFILAVPLVPFAIFGELPGESWVEHPSSTIVVLLGILVLGGDIFLPVPSSLIAVFLAAKLGFILGTLVITSGLTLSSVIGYYAGWYLGYPLVKRQVSEKQRKIVHSFENKYGYLSLAILRSVPVLSEASVLGAGTARMKFRPVFLTLSIANFSLALLYAFLGSASQKTASSTWLIWGGIFVPALGIVVTYLIYKVCLLK